MAKVLLNNINKYYSDQRAVANFNLEARDNEFIVMVGPSGCGKSTVLRIIAGLTEASSGEVFIDDILVDDMPPKDRNIAMIFQNYALYPNKTVYKNLAFGLEMHKVDKKIIHEKVMAVAKMLGIESHLDRKPSQLSGGEKQRVAIGRALVRNPSVFLMDEPLSSLDAKLRNAMRAELLKLHKRMQSTIIYVTHDQIEAMTLGDRIVVMNKGIIQQVDTPKIVYNTPVNKFVAEFIGMPPMNFLMADLAWEDGACRGKLAVSGHSLRLPVNLKADKENQKVNIGIRPEHIQILSRPRDHNTLETKLEIVERMGSEMHLHLLLGEEKIIVKSSTFHSPEADMSLNIYLPPECIHVFDADSGENIGL